MTTTTPVEDLSPQTLNSTPRNIDWQEARGEDMDGWRFWEAFEREVTADDGTDVTLYLVSVDGSEAEVAFTEDGTRIDLNDLNEYFQTLEKPCKHCGRMVTTEDGEIWVDDTNGDGCSGNPEAEDLVPGDLVHQVAGVLAGSDFDALDREAHGYAEGPMMNYWYPLEEQDEDRLGPYRSTFDAAEAAFRLRHHSLCLVEVGGELGLALTGGGMDFTWDIAEAFIDLGYLPPLHFCDLPGMAGKGPGKRLPEGWSVAHDSAAPEATPYVVRNADNAIVGAASSFHGAQQEFAVPHPGSEDDQRIIAAVTRALETARERIGYQLQRHQERYSPAPTSQEG